jgi:DNA gyrase/topoisomerase IV subunit A
MADDIQNNDQLPDQNGKKPYEHEHGNIIKINIEEEMKSAYIDYS